MTDPLSIRIAEAEDAKVALNRFLTPAFDVLRATYRGRLETIAAQPLDTKTRAGIEKLALAIKVLNEAEAQIVGIVNDGKLARDQQDNVRRIERIPTETRRFF